MLAQTVAFVIENPRTSMIRLATEMANLKKRRHCRFFQSDFGLWVMAWRKATGFLAGFCNDPFSKCFWTHIAEAYPLALSTSLAKMLREGRMQLDHLGH